MRNGALTWNQSEKINLDASKNIENLKGKEMEMDIDM